MSHTEVVHVQVRKGTGSRDSRKLREQGRTPAVLYGHGEPSVSLSILSDDIDALVRHGGRVVELQGEVAGNALVRSVQWDSLGSEILHLDLTRVSAGETVETTVPVELRGTAPGTQSGGILEHVTHEVEIKCPVNLIPEKISCSIKNLKLGEAIHVSDLALPEGATMLTDGGQVVVHCIEPAGEDETTGLADGAEPEVIGRKAADEEEEGKD